MINLQLINNVSRAMKYSKGTVMTAQDSGRLHIILSGEAGVMVSGTGVHTLSGRLGPGDFFGETALFLGIKPPESVIALTELITLSVSRDTAIQFFRDEPAVAYEICKALCARLTGEEQAADDAQPLRQTEPVQTPKEKPVAAQHAAPVRQTAAPAPAAPSDGTPPRPPAKTPALDTAIAALFPPGHGDYTLSINNSDRNRLMERALTCPLCQQGFKALSVRQSKLVMESTDSDMRVRYKGIEPLYYDVVTCPHCLYSALADIFGSAKKPQAALLNELQALRDGGIDFSGEVRTETVFAGYYLALRCAPPCFPRHELVTAKLLLKLSRIYQDCADNNMETLTARQALDTYLYVYQNIEIPTDQEPQLCIIIAELSAKLGDNRQARDFFFKVKINRSAAPLLRRQADDRLYDLREKKQ